MKLINHLREFYGFPQVLLAQYVGVSRGHLSMAAIGRKDLQTAAFLKLIKLALAVNNEEGPEQEIIKASHRTLFKDKEASFVNYKILETEHRLVGCQRKLRRMQMKHRQAIHGLACLANLQANPEDPDIDLYKVMEMSTRKVLDKNSEVAQLDLELRIAGLKASAEFLRQRVAARESLAAAETNPGDDNRDEGKPMKICNREHSDNKREAAPIDGAARAERLEANAPNAPVHVTRNGNVFRMTGITAQRLAKAVSCETNHGRVEGSLAAIPANPEDLHMTPDERMGMAGRRRLKKISEVTQFDLVLQASGWKNSRDFSQSKVRRYMHKRRRGKTKGPTKSRALLI